MQSKRDIEASHSRGVSAPGQMFVPAIPPAHLRSFSSTGEYPQMPSVSRNVSVSQVLDEMTIVDGNDETCNVANPVASVVQIYATGVKPNYTSPWMVSEQIQWTASGFLIDGRRIVTNAHCVHNATVLQVQRQDHPKKWRARATTLAHDIDLAIVEVDEEDFWTDVSVAELAPPSYSLDLYSEVIVIGFPLGGSTICVTKGVISRFDAQLYIHAQLEGVIETCKSNPGPVFLLQVDSAINGGSSGGPALDEGGRVVGVASSGREDGEAIGYVIPISILHIFLDEVEKTGTWSGISEIGLLWRKIESDSYRSYLGMKDGETGVLILEVAPLGALNDLVKPGDVVTHIDSLRVSNEGKVPIEVSGQHVYCDFEALVTCKPKGNETSFALLRKNGEDGTLEKVTVNKAMTPIPSFAPRFHGFDAHPDYVLIGGLVFSRLSVPIFRSVLSSSLLKKIDKYKQSDEDEAVIMVNVLQHDINIGSGRLDMPLKSVNGIEIKSLKQLAQIARSLEEPPGPDEGDYVCFCFEKTEDNANKTDLPDDVIQRRFLASANEEICDAYAVSETISPRLLDET